MSGPLPKPNINVKQGYRPPHEAGLRLLTVTCSWRHYPSRPQFGLSRNRGPGVVPALKRVTAANQNSHGFFLSPGNPYGSNNGFGFGTSTSGSGHV